MRYLSRHFVHPKAAYSRHLQSVTGALRQASEMGRNPEHATVAAGRFLVYILLSNESTRPAALLP